MPKPEHHIFVCQNVRDPENPRGCCMARGGGEVLKALKEEVRARNLRHMVEFDGSTCVDCCAWGPTVVVYPENVWYGKVTPADVPELVSAVAEGRVIERLLVPDDQIRKS